MFYGLHILESVLNNCAWYMNITLYQKYQAKCFLTKLVI